MRTRLTAGLGALALTLLSVAAVTATNTDPNADHKVTICHRTGSVDGGNQHNGYDIITVDIASSGFVQGGHTNHEQVGNGPGGDIIPAYDAFAKDGQDWVAFHYDGKNLDTIILGVTGAELLANGCHVGEGTLPTPTPTATPTPATPTPAPPGETPHAAGGGTPPLPNTATTPQPSTPVLVFAGLAIASLLVAATALRLRRR